MKKLALILLSLAIVVPAVTAQVMDDHFKQKILTISEQDFWDSIQPVKGLEKAVAAGQAGKRDAAYRLLGEYHRKSLAVEADAFRQAVTSDAKEAAALQRRREAADKVLRREISGWAGQEIKFGPVIDFNADFGRSGQYGFHYLGWLRPVLDQYVSSKETKYRDDFITVTKQYYDQRTGLKLRYPQLHPVYYELGAWAKTEIFLPAYAVLAGEKALDTQAREAMLKLLLGMARSLHRMQTEYRPGNWQIVGATALYHTAVSFPEFKEAESWRAKALELLKAHAEKDFFADGGHGERCWGYGHMSLGAMATFYKIAGRHKALDPEAETYWQAFLKRGYQWFAASTAPGGFTLNYGDGDIGKSDGIIAEAVALFPELGTGPGQLGIDRSKSNILRPSGYAFMRTADTPDSPFMSINFGHWGGGHTHDDLLDFSIWRYGRPLIEEVGRFGSYDNPMDPFFRSEESHNQIILETIPMNRREHRGQDVLWQTGEAVDFFSAWHEGYPQARIQRQIVFVRPDYWVVQDTIHGEELIFQASNLLHGLKPFQVLGEGKARLEGSPSCLVVSAKPEELRRLTTQVDYAAKDYYGGDRHGLAAERHRLTAMKWRDVGDPRPITFTTLLLPFEGDTPPDVKIEPLAVSGDASGRAEAYAVTWKGRTDTLVFNPAGASLTVAGRTVSAPMAAGIGGSWVELVPGKN